MLISAKTTQVYADFTTELTPWESPYPTLAAGEVGNNLEKNRTGQLKCLAGRLIITKYQKILYILKTLRIAIPISSVGYNKKKLH